MGEERGEGRMWNEDVESGRNEDVEGPRERGRELSAG